MKENKISQRIVDLAKERGYNLERFFTYELTHLNYLFNENNMMKKLKKAKKNLISLPERKMEVNDLLYPIEIKNFCFIVDVMYVSRLIEWKKFKTFFEFATAFCQYVSKESNNQVTRIDFVFDTCLQFSVKNGKRLFRYGEESIELNSITNETPLPKQEKLFWVLIITKRNYKLI